MADDVTIEIGVDASGAAKGVRKFSKTASKSLKSVTDSIFSVKNALIGVSGVLAGRAIIGGLNAVTDAAAVQEDAINAINTAMKISGEFSADAAQGMQDFASGIQESTKFGDEAILQQLALAKSFGATNEQAQDAVTAAVEFAAATGKSLEEANRQVSKTLGGFAGELGEINPAIKALTSEQLKAGEATKILIEQFGGSAQAQINTFSGAVAQTSNTFGDLLEEIGGLITKSPVVVKAISGLNKGFQQLIKFINNNSDAISKFVGKSIIFLIKGFSQVVKSVSAAIVGVSNFIKAALNLTVINDIVANLGQVFNFLTLGVVRAIESIVGTIENLLIFASDIPGVGDKFKDAINGVDEFRRAMEGVGDLISKDILSADKVDTQGIIDNLSAISDTATTVGDDISSVIDNLTDELEELSNKKTVITIETDITAPAPVKVDAAAAKKDRKEALATAATITKGLLGGAEGARKLLVTGASAAADAFFPGAGAVVGPIVEALSQGPEFVTEMVDGFVEALPELLDNIAQAIPALITALVDNADKIIIAVIKAAPALFRAIAIELPKALADPAVWADVATSLVEALAQEITGNETLFFKPEKLKGIFKDAFSDVIEAIKLSLFEPINVLIDFLDDFKFPEIEVPSLGGGGGSGGFIGQTARRVAGGAHGGTIPEGFPNDSFGPINVESGELIIPRTDTDNLRQFLATQQQGGGPDNQGMEAILTRILQALEGGGGVTEVRLSDEGLANAILELDQRSERLTA